jgi:FeS assembly SUF system regulator
MVGSMLRVNRLTDYGTVILGTLADNEGTMYTAAELAQLHQLTLPTVSKILKILSAQGIVKSKSGNGGGYLLARKATEITVAEVVTALEGPVAMTQCCLEQGLCDHEQECSMRGNWQKINSVIFAALGKMSIAQMNTSRCKLEKQ